MGMLNRFAPKNSILLYNRVMIHNLLQLHALSGVSLSEEEISLLAEVNDFNIRARYPEYESSFYKLATQEFTNKYMIKINNLYQKLCKTVK